jgi:hypothetical protein
MSLRVRGMAGEAGRWPGRTWSLKKAESVREGIGRLLESRGGEVRRFMAEVAPGGSGHGKPAGNAWRKLRI